MTPIVRIHLEQLADVIKMSLPPLWRLSITFDGGRYGRYKLADAKGKSVRLPKDIKDVPARICEFAWQTYLEREQGAG